MTNNTKKQRKRLRVVNYCGTDIATIGLAKVQQDFTSKRPGPNGPGVRWITNRPGWLEAGTYRLRHLIWRKRFCWQLIRDCDIDNEVIVGAPDIRKTDVVFEIDEGHYLISGHDEYPADEHLKIFTKSDGSYKGVIANSIVSIYDSVTNYYDGDYNVLASDPKPITNEITKELIDEIVKGGLNQDFWALWRAHKDEIKTLGYSVIKDEKRNKFCLLKNGKSVAE